MSYLQIKQVFLQMKQESLQLFSCSRLLNFTFSWGSYQKKKKNPTYQAGSF